jgi:hypothetical protein
MLLQVEEDLAIARNHHLNQVEPHRWGSHFILNRAKPEGNEPPQCRPVAAGDIERRVSDKVIFTEAQNAIRTQLLPQQLGVGIRAGVQLYIWAAKLELEMCLRDGSDQIFIKLDQKNAHNSYSRAAAQRALEAIPGARRMAELHRATFGVTSRLISRTPKGVQHVCDSVEAGQQGNPLVPAAYTLVLDPVLKQFDALLGGRGHVRAYQDDIFISGDRTTVLLHIQSLIDGLRSIGGELASGAGKNCCFIPTGNTDGVPPWLHISSANFVVDG